MATRPLTIFQLGSGSSGNATVFLGDDGAVLVDAGFSAKQTLERALRAGVPEGSIRGIVVTHGHGDHASGVPVLARRLKIPVWASEPTLKGMRNLRGGEELHAITPGDATQIAGLQIDTLGVSHDAPGTLIVRVEGRAAIATDLGTFDSTVCDFLDDLDGLLLEFNHDVDLLADGDYPEWLKARVASNQGHLSNEQAAELLTGKGFRLPRQALWLCHLSQHNNTPHLAAEAAREVVDGRALRVLVTRQAQASPAVELT